MHTDTIALLGDCTTGIDRAVSGINALLPDISDRGLRKRLRSSIHEHQVLYTQAQTMLLEYGGQLRTPSAIARGVNRLKTGARMVLGDSTTAAELVAHSCDRGVRMLSRSCNRYTGATSDAVDLTRKLIRCEEILSSDLRAYL